MVRSVRVLGVQITHGDRAASDSRNGNDYAAVKAADPVTVTATVTDATRFTATLDGASTFVTATTVTVSVGGGGATSGADYAAVANFDVTIAAGEASGTGTFDLAPTQGTLHEDTETIGVTGASRVTVTGDVISLMHDHAELGLGVCRQKRPVPLAMQVVEVQATQLLRGGRQVDDPRRRRELR